MPTNRNIDWPAALVATAFLALVLGISITAILKYNTVDDALRWWDGLSAFAGLLTGAIGTFFFTRGQVSAAEQQRTDAEKQRTEAQKQADEERDRANTERELAKDRGDALTAIVGQLEPGVVDTLKQHPAIQKVL
jgi:glucose-6-phosphate-specific signal transduction histidine kinase